MVRVIALLIFVAYGSGSTTPTLWGSRVVAKVSGWSDTMHFECDGDFNATITRGSVVSPLTVRKNTCFVNGTQKWGRPCRFRNNKAAITLWNVQRQQVLTLTNVRPNVGIASTTFFAPRCKFPRPALGEVDVNSSFPLSRFVQGLEKFEVDFAVRGVKLKSPVVFYINAVPQCSWWGTQLVLNQSPVCAELVKDVRRNLRVFHGVFSGKTNRTRDRFTFTGANTALVVSVDYMQRGDSPEVAECNQFAKDPK